MGFSTTSPLISVVTPAYNAEQFLPGAYACLCRQTYKTWEWVVVDDGSTDRTYELLNQLAGTDSRVRPFTQPNSGSAKQPRDHAVYESKGEWIVMLDADDSIPEDYLQRMMVRQVQTDADIVYPRLDYIGSDTTEPSLPTADVDTTKVYEGRGLVRYTMPTWRIGCNGGLYRRNVWVNMSYPHRQAPLWMNSDEVDERLYLLEARRVAFCDVRYRYLRHPASITKHFSAKLFHPLKTNQQLVDLASKEFGKDSEEYTRAQQQAFQSWRYLLRLFVLQFDQMPDAVSQVFTNLYEAFLQLDARILTKKECVQFLGLRSFKAIFTLFCLKYRPCCLTETLLRIHRPQWYATHTLKSRTQQRTLHTIIDSYAAKSSREDPEHTAEAFVVNIFDGSIPAGGLVDRLRGIVSTYSLCQQTNRPYRLLFEHPFRLTDYLQPAAYNWTVTTRQLHYKPSQVAIEVSETLIDTPAERKAQRRQLERAIRRNSQRQTHVYTNAAFSYDEDFPIRFNQLFKPSPRLEEALHQVCNKLGDSYIAVSARFRNLLDDFNEENYSEPLNTQRKQMLLDACIRQLQELHTKHPGPMLVCSDSTTFLQTAARLSFVHTISGTVSHIDNDRPQSYQYYQKTFLDFFVISRASHVFLLRHRLMYASGFPYCAALIGDKPFETIHF